VTDVAVEAGVSQIQLATDGQGYAYVTKDTLKVKMGAAGKDASKTITELFCGSKSIPKTTENMRLFASADGRSLGLSVGNQALMVGADLGKPSVLSFGKLEKFEVKNLLPGGSESSFVIATGDVTGEVSPKSFVGIWKAGATKPEGVVMMDGSLEHSLVAVTAEEEFVVGAMTTPEGKSQLAIVKLETCEALPAVPTGKITQLRVSTSEQVVGLLEENKDIRFVYAGNSSELEKYSHSSHVCDFDVNWEEGKVILAEQQGQIAVRSRSGRDLLSFMANPSGISTVKYISDSLTILTPSGLIKAWDTAAISSVMIRTSSTDTQTSDNSGSLKYLTDIVNVMIHESGEELITFSANGAVTVWNIETQKKLRAFNIGLTANILHPLSFNLAAAHDKNKKQMKFFSVENGQSLCEDIIPKSVLAATVTADRKSVIAVSEQPHLVLQKIDLDGKSGKVVKTVNIQLGFSYVNIEIKLCSSERYLVLMVRYHQSMNYILLS
jgi:hypothetical protein